MVAPSENKKVERRAEWSVEKKEYSKVVKLEKRRVGKTVTQTVGQLE
jgi:hypothetical protein